MVPLIASILYACANTASVARIHPEAVKGLPNCTECHTDSWGALNHKAPDFMARHKIYRAIRSPSALTAMPTRKRSSRATSISTLPNVRSPIAAIT